MTASQRLAGRTALITGAAGGIGSATARRFAEEGANVIALDRQGTEEALARLVSDLEALGVRAVSRVADVTDQASLDAAVQSAAAELGGVDTVFANAGVLSTGIAEEVTEEVWQQQIDVNLGGVWRTVKAVAPLLKANRDPGNITVTSSTAGLRASAGSGTYAAAKHGVVGLARAWAHEFGPYGVRVNTVHPSAVATPLVLNEENLRRARPDLENPTPEDVRELWTRGKLLDVAWIDPVDVANAVLFLSSDEARYITGAQLPIDGGSTTKWG
ncbi:MAG: mycofactocin-coupled SDR family oxidoreductase [Leucobacter sp.]